MKSRLQDVFPGGIHPTNGFDKELSKLKTIEEFIPSRVEITMEQSPGAICHPNVEVGDKVLKGDLIGTPASFTAVPLHASITGIVTNIKIGQKGESIICIENVEKNISSNEKSGYGQSFVSMDNYSKQELIDAMKNGGLVGMGGAGFPTHIKYETKEIIHTLLINGAECEPYLTCDYRLMLEYGYELMNGVRLLLKASGANNAFICIEENKMDAIKYLTDLISKESIPIEIKALPVKYPQGGERQLIQAVLGKELPKGALPSQIGVIVSNVGTAKVMADIVLGNEKLTKRIVTVTGNVNDPRNYLVPIGTRISELLTLANGYSTKQTNVIVGGPMTGQSIAVNVPTDKVTGTVTKTTSGIVVLENENYEESPCIRCGACSNVCPAGLNPFKIDFAYLDGNLELCEKLFATECIGCGSCSYVCPAKRELARRTVLARNDVRTMQRERGK